MEVGKVEGKEVLVEAEVEGDMLLEDAEVEEERAIMEEWEEGRELI